MLTIDKEDRVAVVTLRTLENAINPAKLRRDLAQAVSTLAADDSVSVILITGAVADFAHGLDLTHLGADALEPGDGNPAEAILACAKPVLCAVTGAAFGGGLEIALACDVVVASTNARFADTHAKTGVTPSETFRRRLIQAVGLQRALHLALSGVFIEAEEAYPWGLVARLTAPEQLAEEALRLAKDMAALPLESLMRHKALMTGAPNSPPLAAARQSA